MRSVHGYHGERDEEGKEEESRNWDRDDGRARDDLELRLQTICRGELFREE